VDYLVEGKGLKKHYPVQQGLLKRRVAVAAAVDGVTLRVKEGQTLALVGESGSGKTTVGKMLLGLLEPTSGEVIYRGRSLKQLSPGEMRKLRSEMQIVFQDPDASLNPRQSIRRILGLPFRVHSVEMGERQRNERIAELLNAVGLVPPREYIDRYPHQLSGGQKQRVNIARAIALRPKLIVADEPVSALDVSVRAQILKLLKRLQEEMNIAYLFITHDLAVVRSLAHSVSVMYLGQVVESASTARIFESALHPYTQSLLLSTPVPRPVVMRRRITPQLMGEVPSIIDPPSGCRFHPRCRYAEAVCSEVEPALAELEEGHFVSCHVAARGDIKPVGITIR
jgi:oligopeptide/dipeptide ABC transporter ATP-binding protein